MSYLKPGDLVQTERAYTFVNLWRLAVSEHRGKPDNRDGGELYELEAALVEAVTEDYELLVLAPHGMGWTSINKVKKGRPSS